MNKRKSYCIFSVLLWSFLLVATVPAPVLSKEDTVHLLFEKTATSESAVDTYTVKKNEWLFDIIRRRYNVSNREAREILKCVRRLNSGINDLDHIYPGQKILLPKKKTRPGSEPASGKVVRTSASHESKSEITISSKEKPILRYKVKKGDNISAIIRRELGVPRGSVIEAVKAVRRLNPKIRNLNKIYVGQTLLLPGVVEEAPSKLDEPSEKTPFKLGEKELFVIKRVVNRLGGSVTSDGIYGIPIPPYGQVTIDCSRVLVLEVDSGNTVLVDSSCLIPANLRGAIESTWKNYTVMGGEKKNGIASILEEIIKASGKFSLKKNNDYIKIGDDFKVGVFAVWTVSENSSLDGEARLYGFNFVRDPSLFLPSSVNDYMKKNGLEMIEIAETGVVSEGREYKVLQISELDSGDMIRLADSLLVKLGYCPSRNSMVKIFDMASDGLDMSIRADILLGTKSGNIIIKSDEIPGHFLNILKKRGDRVVIISKKGKKSETVINVLKALDVACSSDNFRFPVSGRNGEIILPALKVEGKDGVFYMVDYEIDGEIYGLLREKWGIEVVGY